MSTIKIAQNKLKDNGGQDNGELKDILETSISSDSSTVTEFFDLPLPPLPSKALQVQNLGFNHSIAAFICYRGPDIVEELIQEEESEQEADDEKDNNGTSESSLSLNSAGTGDAASTLQNDSRWCTSDEDSSFYKDRPSTCKYDSTCCDEDFTWVCSETSVEPQQKPSSNPTAIINNTTSTSTSNTIGKPPPRPLGSLDRKRHQNHANRRDRDQKSKSAHSLRDKHILNDTKDPYHRFIPKIQQKDNDNFYNESSSSYTNLRCKRGSPAAYWEPPPPPPLPHPGYDFHPYWGYSSREDLRMHDYYNKRHEFCHYGSTNTLPLSSSQEFFSNSPCCGSVGGGVGRYPPNYCLCNHKNSSMWNLNQVIRKIIECFN